MKGNHIKNTVLLHGRDINTKIVNEHGWIPIQWNAAHLILLPPYVTPSDFTNQKPSGVPTFLPAAIKSNKPSHTPISGPSDKPSGIPSVSISVHPITLPSTTPITLPPDLRSEKPVKSQAFIHYSFQLVYQVWLYLFKIVNSQKMFQVCNQSVDQLIGLFIFQYCILASNLVYHYH